MKPTSVVLSSLLPLLLVLLALPAFGAAPACFDGTAVLDALARGLPAPARIADDPGLMFSRAEVPPADHQEFWTFNFAANAWEKTAATLVGTYDHCLFYLENGKTVSDAALKKLAQEFERTIYPTTTEYFGRENIPGIDGDPRITFLLMDIRDTFNATGSYVAGYFNRGDQYREGELPADANLKTNQREILYLDLHPADIAKPEFFSTLAHEFQHLIHFNHDPNEYPWVNEGCSQMAPWFCGYGYPSQLRALIADPDNSLTAWSQLKPIANYGHVFLWNFYLTQRLLATPADRKAFFRALVADKETGRPSYDALLKARKTDFLTLFRDFCLANILHSEFGTTSIYGYGKELKDFQLPTMAFVQALPGLIKNEVSPWGADAIKVALPAGKASLRLDFAGDLTISDNQFDVLVAFLDTTDRKVLDVSRMTNIKATTPRTAPVARVMFPGNNDDFPLPPPPMIRTQMGSLAAAIPAGADQAMILVIGKTPDSVLDIDLLWEGKARYRLDIKDLDPAVVTNNSIVQPCAEQHPDPLTGMISRLAELAETAPASPHVEALEQEILNTLRTRLETTGKSAGADLALWRADLPVTPAFAHLRRQIQTLESFSGLHTPD